MDQKQESNLILQRSVGGQDNHFKEYVKDPQQEFKVIGVIRQGTITEQGKQMPIYYLYDLKGVQVASEKDRLYLEEKTAVKSQERLRAAAQEKWREDALAKARTEEGKSNEKPTEKENPQNGKQQPAPKTKAKTGKEGPER
jgi:hypothetical protein